MLMQCSHSLITKLKHSFFLNWNIVATNCLKLSVQSCVVVLAFGTRTNTCQFNMYKKELQNWHSNWWMHLKNLRYCPNLLFHFCSWWKKIYLDEGCENVLSNVVRIELFMQFFIFVLYLHFFYTRFPKAKREKQE